MFNTTIGSSSFRGADFSALKWKVICEKYEARSLSLLILMLFFLRVWLRKYNWGGQSTQIHSSSKQNSRVDVRPDLFHLWNEASLDLFHVGYIENVNFEV